MLKKKAHELLDQLFKNHTTLLNWQVPNDVIAVFDKTSSEAPYNYIPDEVSNLWSLTEHNREKISFGLLSRVIMLELILNFENRTQHINYTDNIIKCFEATFTRILNSIEDLTYAAYNSVNDIFLKDLALCRQQVFPAGGLVVEPRSGFSRSLMFRGGLGQFMKFISFLFEIGGNWPLFQTHMHLSELGYFNPEGRKNGYLRIAEMLSINPEIKGMFAGSWYFDPALETVSPRLAYLRKQPQDNGARIFYSGVDEVGGALSKSSTRQRLYKEGKYMPKSYVLIWPRKKMIEWAQQY